MYVHAWYLGKTKKRELDPLVAVSCHLGAANQTQIRQSKKDADYPALNGWVGRDSLKHNRFEQQELLTGRSSL